MKIAGRIVSRGISVDASSTSPKSRMTPAAENISNW